MTLTAGRYLRQFLFTEGTLGVVVQTALQTLKTEGVTARCRHGLVKQPKKEERKHVRLETRSRTDKHICGLWLCKLFVKYEWNNYSEKFGWILWDLYLIQSGHSRSAGSKIGLTSGLSDSVTGSGEKNNHTINNVTPDIVCYIYQKNSKTHQIGVSCVGFASLLPAAPPPLRPLSSSVSVLGKANEQVLRSQPLVGL